MQEIACVVFLLMEIRRPSTANILKISWRRDLNPRPSDYKSDALPTELRQHCPKPAKNIKSGTLIARSLSKPNIDTSAACHLENQFYTLSCVIEQPPKNYFPQERNRPAILDSRRQNFKMERPHSHPGR